MARTIRARYVDPLDQIWLAAAARLGLRVRRDATGYATTDGRGLLTIAPVEELDADDCLAQIIFHELCHALVQGYESFQVPDWGLGNDELAAGYEADTTRERACLRVQASLLRKHGLRELLAPTTDYRAFYDSLPPDPMDPMAAYGGPADAALPLARAGLARAARPPFEGVLEDALTRTATIHGAVLGCAGRWFDDAPPPQRHPLGAPLHEDPALRCGGCAWCEGGRCGRQGRRADAAWPACVLHEAGPLDCQRCAACCRHAYDAVLIGPRELLRRRHPELVERDGEAWRVRREGERCAALTGPEQGPYACSVYADRPRPCRDFRRGGEHCLSARRRVGASV